MEPSVPAQDQAAPLSLVSLLNAQSVQNNCACNMRVHINMHCCDYTHTKSLSPVVTFCATFAPFCAAPPQSTAAIRSQKVILSTGQQLLLDETYMYCWMHHCSRGHLHEARGRRESREEQLEK